MTERFRDDTQPRELDLHEVEQVSGAAAHELEHVSFTYHKIDWNPSVPFFSFDDAKLLG